MSLEAKASDKPRGANRSTKAAGKLKVLPEQPDQPIIPQAPKTGKLIDVSETPAEAAEITQRSESSDEEEEDDDIQDQEDVEVYNQIAQIPEGTARKDALRLTKKKAKSLPRVTAYCTAESYRMDELLKFFHARKSAYRTAVRRFDEVIYTPYSYDHKPHSRAGSEALENVNDNHRNSGADGSRILHDIPEDNMEVDFSSPVETRNSGRKRKVKRFETVQDEGQADVFLFEYGTVVMWGMTEAQEKRFLNSIRRFEVEKLPPESVEMEDLNFYYADYSRIYNDVITLRKGSSYMTKLSLSHALSQSVKISLFEELISDTIEHTKDIPAIISSTGKIGMNHKDIMRQIGQLFMLRININLVGSVLDAPEIFWGFPDLQPLYDAARSYLEIPQRTRVLNDRVEVLQDMLQLLKESASSSHAERLEKIVIILIGLEIGARRPALRHTELEDP
ncbi:hypothetical protein M422DRAFT_781155 [Sphaerobolus stellatus SS14]|uniref:Unplaced genomic scaffold SPHSTscaffold_80, whole genome shotgun sequence n=1 Tax=Sphaerobolus stellatus (strain SS14) TaxID=990650 RepID=A0A0C9VM81_SPHS4|nr:hypothetical protein M422DRAFT_781155 [Sphaerobolus stellatus SS14]